MTTLGKLLQDVDAAPDGPGTGAIFDFDGTVIAGYSATAFLGAQLRRGDLSATDLAALTNALSRFGMGTLGFSGLMAMTAQFLRDIPEAEYIALGEDLYRQKIARLVYPETRQLIRAHQRKGHTVAIISSATRYQVQAAARDLDIEHVLCTELDVQGGKFTGDIKRPTCFGEGKVTAAEQLATVTGTNLDQSFFYTDSTDDLQLLERVGLPRTLNASDRLQRLAQDRQWPSARFGSRGRPTMTQFLRSVAATVSLVPTFLAGIPIYALTGSRRESINFSLSLFADTASALIGLDLRVEGEEHLWAQRPAVFVFNHQSKTDVIIVARLLRRDIAGIGKKEIRRIPVLGKVLEMGGVVMIDRANARSAIKAMQPLVDAMREQGKSVAIAPEGTRTVSPRLGPFKKGAFHLALQAGVPIVPIVIRNAGDVAPKGDFVFRPATVDVTVLPPIDTSGWRAETMSKHVRAVRQLFLEALGQTEAAPPAEPGSSTTAPRKATAPIRAAARKPRAPLPTVRPKLKPSAKPPPKVVQRTRPRKSKQE